MDVERRLHALELELRWTRRAMLILALPLAAAIFLAASPRAGIGKLEGRELKIVDDDGNTVVRVAARESDGLGGVETYWPNGRVAFSTFSAGSTRGSAPPAGGFPRGGVLESRVDGEFEGWDGDTIVKLMDGSIWKQEDLTLDLHLAFSPRVTVFPRNGGFAMLVDGCGKAVRVSRLK